MLNPVYRPALVTSGGFLVLLFGLILAVAIGSSVPAGAQAVVSSQPVVTATPAPIAIISVGQASTLADPINAYGAPDGAALIGPVERGRRFTPIARTADGNWIQVDVLGSGLVWTPIANIRNLDVAGLAVVEAPPAPVVADRVGEVGGHTVSVSAPTQELADAIYSVREAQITGQPAPEQAQQVVAQAACTGPHECSGDAALIRLINDSKCSATGDTFACSGREAPAADPLEEQATWNGTCWDLTAPAADGRMAIVQCAPNKTEAARLVRERAAPGGGLQAEPTPAPHEDPELAPIQGGGSCGGFWTQAECDAIAAEDAARASAATDSFLDTATLPAAPPEFVNAVNDACAKDGPKEGILKAFCQ